MTYTLYFSYGMDIELLEHYQVSADAENPEKPVLGTSRGTAGYGELSPGGSIICGSVSFLPQSCMSNIYT